MTADSKKEELIKLNKFLGFGDFSKTQILFFGQEEGLGPEQPQLSSEQRCRGEVELRLKYLTRKSMNTFFLNDNDPSDGYWVLGNDTDALRNECYQDLGFAIRKNPESVKLRGTWSCPARMQRALEENNEEDMERWFSKENWVNSLIREQVAEGLYARDRGVRIGLTDWRPIPKRNLNSEWLYEGIDDKQFKNAFAFKRTSDSFYKKLCEERVRLYDKLFHTYHIPVVCCYGSGLRKERKELFRQIADDKEGAIHKATILPMGKKYIEWVEARFNGKITTVIFTDHFTRTMDYQSLFGVTKQIRRLLRGQKINLS